MERLDVARGRRVPAPFKGSRKNVERVLESLNPYSSNENVAVVLDLISIRGGAGAALKCLAHLDPDVMDNWKPFQVTIYQRTLHDIRRTKANFSMTKF